MGLFIHNTNQEHQETVEDIVEVNVQREHDDDGDDGSGWT